MSTNRNSSQKYGCVWKQVGVENNKDTLKRLRRIIKNKSFDLLSPDAIVLHDKACPHVATTVPGALADNMLNVLYLTAYSPHMSPCSDHFFATLKGLKGKLKTPLK